MRFLIALFILALPVAVLGGAIVEVRTSLGVFYLELNERAAPESSENFLAYVTKGLYDNSFVYGTADLAFVRGGGYTFSSCPDGVQRIAEQPPIDFEQTNLANKRGSISLVHSYRSDNAFTSDWIINLDDNFKFDNAGTGYTPFGEVIGSGLDVVIAIALANQAQYSDPFDSLGADFFPEPVTCETPASFNYISVAMTVVNSDGDLPSGRYNSISNELQVNIYLPDDDYLSLPFAVNVTETGEITITARLEQAISLEKPMPNMARYDVSTRGLTLHSLEIDDIVAYANVNFVGVGNSNATFRLVSFEEI